MRQRIPFLLAFLVMIAVSQRHGARSPQARADEPAAVIPGESRPTATRLQEASKRLKDKKPAESIALLQNVIDGSGNALVALKSGRALCARHLAHAVLARLDAAGLALYRRKADPQAQKWFEQWQKTGDATLLRRIIDEAFCSKPAQLALVQLGDSAFERGRFDEAEAWWGALVPLEPIKLDEADPDTLVYPDPAEELVARTRAKQLLARLFRGQHGWKADLEAFRKRHPKAAGNLAGRKGIYADILGGVARDRAGKTNPLLADWPTFAGNFQRGRAASAHPNVLERLSQLCRRGATWQFDLEEPRHSGRQLSPSQTGPGSRGGSPLGLSSSGCRQTRHHRRRPLHHRLRPEDRQVQHLVRRGEILRRHQAQTRSADLAARHSVYAHRRRRASVRPHGGSVSQGCATRSASARQDRDESRRFREPARLSAADPGKDGDRRCWVVRAIDPGRKEFGVFEGVAGRFGWPGLYRRHPIRGRSSHHRHPLLSRQPRGHDSIPPMAHRRVRDARIAAGQVLRPEHLSRRQRNRHHLLTLAGSRIVYCSHSGAIVAVDARTGRRAWAVKYPRRDTRDPTDAPTLRDLAPCLFADGRLYVAPNDSESLMCLDPATGATLWQRDRVDAVHLLGVGQGRLIFTTWRNPRQGNLFAGGLRAVMADDGSDTGGWSLPDDGGGLAPFGRPLLIGDLVLWPTPVPSVATPGVKPRTVKRYGVFAVRQINGLQPDNPALLHQVPSGNLVYANGCLLVADQQTLYAFVPPEMLPDEGDKEKAGLSPREALEQARRAAARGQTDRALDYYALAVKDIDEADPGQSGRRLLEEVRLDKQDVYLEAAEKATKTDGLKKSSEWRSKALDRRPRHRLYALLWECRSKEIAVLPARFAPQVGFRPLRADRGR